jgi:dihydroorotate dehydrogenase electron transfer subunit
MHTGTGRIVELLFEDGCAYARISCQENLIPAPGQYLLASHGSDSLLPVPIFHTDLAPQGFIGNAIEGWKPGDMLALRGPLGQGFSLPVAARKVALIAFDGPPSRLRGLVPLALRQNASIVLSCDSSAEHLPDDVEIQPLSTLEDILRWADFAAFDVKRENLKDLMEKLGAWKSRLGLHGAQVLVHTPMPCGGLADCGVCALTTKSDWKLVCKEGPVFDLGEI